jgi:hypothetical protein
MGRMKLCLPLNVFTKAQPSPSKKPATKSSVIGPRVMIANSIVLQPSLASDETVSVHSHFIARCEVGVAANAITYCFFINRKVVELVLVKNQFPKSFDFSPLESSIQQSNRCPKSKGV